MIACKDRAQRSQSSSQRQLERTADSVFSHQRRLFVWGLSIYSFSKDTATKKDFFRVHLYCRSGTLYSREYALDDDSDKLCQLPLGFARMSPREHGWYLVDPRLAGQLLFAPKFPKESREGSNSIPIDSEGLLLEPPINLRIPDHTSNLNLADIPYVKDGIDGRATVNLLW